MRKSGKLKNLHRVQKKSDGSISSGESVSAERTRRFNRATTHGGVCYTRKRVNDHLTGLLIQAEEEKIRPVSDPKTILPRPRRKTGYV